jgi:hypothetical protein
LTMNFRIRKRIVGTLKMWRRLTSHFCIS